jgi:hypothetical protein
MADLVYLIPPNILVLIKLDYSVDQVPIVEDFMGPGMNRNY